MKYLFIIIGVIVNIGGIFASENAWIRINQLGYLPDQIKVAVFLSTEENGSSEFVVRETKTDEIIYKGIGQPTNAERWGMKQALRLNFSTLNKEGGYYIVCNGSQSPSFKIGPDVYDGSADFLLKYMRQQRCGYNPYLDTVCHQHDGFIVDHPELTGQEIDVRGGWHDASDYLQYLPTSANATFQMMFAWQQNPDTAIFKDKYGSDGKKGSNGIPDILDEIRWGLEWLERMNPDSAIMFNQIADDRDHAKMRLPSLDSVDYGWGEGTGRPVYFITGKPQGLGNYKNRTTGVASSAGKFSSAFALGAELFKDIDPAFAARLKTKSAPAFHFGEARPGNTQTACLRSPYFYEEDNYVDDLELAAAVHYDMTNDNYWLTKADYWGTLEEITPWMELGRARHYQFYPFVNLGHFYLAKSEDKSISDKYIRSMRSGLECLLKRAKEYDDPFINGVPFIWCSNNLVAAAITQANLYRQVSGDDTYAEMEASLRDWLLGCNPWGTSMICGFPAGGDSPTIPHSAYVDLLNDIPYGGLVDGPIYKTLYESLRGIYLKHDDPYAPFQFGAAVYHDDPGDYSSNEPTMDGTASLSFYFSRMESEGKRQMSQQVERDAYGCIIRMNKEEKKIYLVFTADQNFEGAPVILKTLKQNKAKGSFFLTGNCLRDKSNQKLIAEIIKGGHYIGGHSDKHLLYASWEDRNHSLVSRDSLLADLKLNLSALKDAGVNMSEQIYFMPPYEWYNAESVNLIESMGLKVVNYTPGTGTAADYTLPEMKNYRSSEDLIKGLYSYEAKHGLNGALILIHPGTEAGRTDKLYNRLDEVIRNLIKKGYVFDRL